MAASIQLLREHQPRLNDDFLNSRESSVALRQRQWENYVKESVIDVISEVVTARPRRKLERGRNYKAAF